MGGHLRAGAYYGHLVLRLSAGLILSYTAHILCKERVTMEELLCSVKHCRHFLGSARPEFQGLSWERRAETI
jgi:hypothetical protein